MYVRIGGVVMDKKKVLIGGILVVCVVLLVWFWPKKDNNNPDFPNRNTTDKINRYLYSWKSSKYIYNDNSGGNVLEYNLHNFILDFYENDMEICFKKNQDGGNCEKHNYSFKDNKTLHIEGKSEISNIYGIFNVIEAEDNRIIMEKNNEDGTSVIFEFIKYGGEK